MSIYGGKVSDQPSSYTRNKVDIVDSLTVEQATLFADMILVCAYVPVHCSARISVHGTRPSRTSCSISSLNTIPPVTEAFRQSRFFLVPGSEMRISAWQKEFCEC
jgi:hypothetical protein